MPDATGPDPEHPHSPAELAAATAALAGNAPPTAGGKPYDHRGRSGDGTVRCPECGDSYWVEVELDASVRPCSRCRPAAYARWAEGAYRGYQDLPEPGVP